MTIHGQGGSGCPTQVTFLPGLYVIYGGGIDVNGGCLNGTCVTFYDTGTTSGPNQCKRIQIQGNVEIVARVVDWPGGRLSESPVLTS